MGWSKGVWEKMKESGTRALGTYKQWYELYLSEGSVFMSAMNFQGGLFTKSLVTPLASGATVTYSTDQVLGGVITDVITAACAATLPTPAAIVAAIPGCVVGTTFELIIRNLAASAITITVTANGASTIAGTATIAQNTARTFKAIVTNVTPGSEAVVFTSVASATV